MTSGSAEPLVLGLGNLVLADDGVGLRIAEALCDTGVEVVDGGTQGLALLGLIEHRPALLICDAVGLGAAPGTVHVLRQEEIWNLPAHRPSTAHEGNARGLLQAARLLGVEPEFISVVGIEPGELRSRIGLSAPVEAALPAAIAAARAELERLAR
jgi:hydrogenase maturation protease